MFLKFIKDPLRLMFFWVGLAAVGLYIFYFSVNREFWLDEAFLGINILDRSYFELWFPLDFKQAAPPLFLMLAKFLYQMPLGLSLEQSLRLYSLLCGIGSVVLFPLVARNFIKNRLILLMTFILFCFNFRIIYYVQEFKQYGPDVFWGLLLTFVFLRLKINKIKNLRLFFYGLLLGCLLFLSYSTVFFMAAGFATLFFDKCISFKPLKVNKKYFWKLFRMGVGYFIPFLLFLFMDFLNPYHDFMYAWWVNLGGFLEKDFSNFFAIFYSFLDYFFWWGIAANSLLLRIILYVPPFILMLILLICPAKYTGKKLAFFSFLLLGILGASYLNAYPFVDRSLLYFCPLFLIILGAGADSARKGIRELSCLFLMFWLLTTGAITAFMTQHYQFVPFHDMRSAVEALKKENDSTVTPIYLGYRILFPFIPGVPTHTSAFLFYKKYLNYLPESEILYDIKIGKSHPSLECGDYFSPHLVSGKKYVLIWERGFADTIYGWHKIPRDCFTQFGMRSHFKKKGSNLYFWIEP